MDDNPMDPNANPAPMGDEPAPAPEGEPAPGGEPAAPEAPSEEPNPGM